jgi:ABC-2 type transport system ATP-binding protein
MKQRLGIAQALLCDPELIVLDEPTNGLDPQGMKEVRELIHRLSTERGMTVFLSSHLLNEVEQVATRMAIINKGQLIVQGSVEELLHANVGKFVFDVTPTKKGLALLRKVETIESVEATDTGIIAEMKRTDVHQVIANLVEAGCRVHSVSPQRSLEEFFLSVVEEPEANNRMQR